MNFSLGAHAEVIRLFKLDSISQPHADDLGMGEFYLESCRFSLCGFDIGQASLDCNFPSCEDFLGGKNNRMNPSFAASVQVDGKQKVQRLSSLESLVSFSCHRIGLEPVLCNSLRFNNTS